jgi:glycolate oxidase iron-sulfur subunit
MRAIADGELEVGPEFADEMSYCLGCLACQTACPAGVKYAELFETARADIERAGVSASIGRRFWRTLTLGFLFQHPDLLRTAGAALRFYQRSGLEGLVRRTGLTRLLPPSLRRLEPQAPRIAPAFSNRLIAEHERPPHGPVRHQVALLTGCIQDLAYPDVNRDTADVLLANGCAVHTPFQQPCCGSLHAHNGETAQAQRLARRLIDLLPPEQYDAIISNAGGCGSHLRHYGHLLADDPAYRDRARVWDAKLRDVHEWLEQIGCRTPEASPFEAPASVTYHESCHLTHGQRVVREPRAVLRRIPGLSLVELPEAAWCCGSAGVYAITQPEQSQDLLVRKTANIVSTQAQIVAAANPGCQLQIERGLASAGAAVQVVHPISLLARAYRRERRRDGPGAP